jgi:hypothetical protein
MKDNREAFSGDRIENFLHEDEALPRSEVGDTAARNGKPFAGTGSAMLGLWFYKCQLLSPKIAFTIGHFSLIAATHGG